MSKPNFKISKAKDFLTVALIIGLPMLTIVAESETGSALVYVGFLFVLYREGLTGWLIAIAGMCILLFILTLTASSYTSILVLAGIVTLAYFLRTSRFGTWIKRCGLPLLFFAFLPRIWTWLCEWLVPGGAALGSVDPSVAEAITLAAVMALMAIGIVTVVVYKLFVSEKGAKVAIPGGFSFSWN